MPITRTGMNTTGFLRTINDEAKVVELPEDDAMARLPKLYAYYEKLEAEIRKAELDIGRLLRSVNCVDAEADELKDAWSQMRTRDEDKLKLWEHKVLMKEIIVENESFRKAKEKEKRKGMEEAARKKREEERETEKRRREMEERDARKKCEEDDRKKKRDEGTTVAMHDFEERFTRIERMLARAGFSSSDRESEDRHSEASRSSRRRYDANSESDGSSQSTHRRQRQRRSHRERDYDSKTSYDEYYKVPELLPVFTSEDDDPEQFVEDFNSILECLEERNELRKIFWFKNRVRVTGNRWDTGLSPKRHNLKRYQKEFLKYFWSPAMQRLAVENFERHRLDFKSKVSISRQITNLYSKVTRIRSDPISDSKFKREIVKKLPQSIRGIFICDKERSITEFAAKVAEVIADAGFTSSPSWRRPWDRDGRNYDSPRRDPTPPHSPNSQRRNANRYSAPRQHRDNYRSHEGEPGRRSRYSWPSRRESGQISDHQSDRHRDRPSGYQGRNQGSYYGNRFNNNSYRTREFRRSPPKEKINRVERKPTPDKKSDGRGKGSTSDHGNNRGTPSAHARNGRHRTTSDSGNS